MHNKISQIWSPSHHLQSVNSLTYRFSYGEPHSLKIYCNDASIFEIQNMVLVYVASQKCSCVWVCVLYNQTMVRFFPLENYTNKKKTIKYTGFHPYHRQTKNSLRYGYQMARKKYRQRKGTTSRASMEEPGFKQKEIMRWLFSNVIRMNERSFVLITRAVFLLLVLLLCSCCTLHW